MTTEKTPAPADTATEETETPTDTVVDETPTEDATDETPTDAPTDAVTDAETGAEDVTSALEDAINRAKDQLLELLQQGQAGATKGYGKVVDRIEQFDAKDLPGYDRLSKIDTSRLPTETVTGYVHQAGEMVRNGREAVTKAVADRRN